MADHLDNETSISAELTASGLKASAKSRAIAAIDRLLGSMFDQWTVRREIRAAEERAASSSKIVIIESAAKTVAAQIALDPVMAQAILDEHIRTKPARDNKRAVVELAIQELTNNPPTPEDSNSDVSELNGDFLNRFDKYSSEASDERFREIWAKVLAGEIKRPGVISKKAMRIIDEMEPHVALHFEELCKYRYGINIPKALCGDLNRDIFLQLVDAGLLVGEHQSQNICILRLVDIFPVKTLFFNSGKRGLFFEPINVPENIEDQGALARYGNLIGLRIYLLTPPAAEIASLFPATKIEEFDRLAQEISKQIAPSDVVVCDGSTAGQIHLIKGYNAGQEVELRRGSG